MVFDFASLYTHDPLKDNGYKPQQQVKLKWR